MPSSVTTESSTLVESPVASSTRSGHRCLRCTPDEKKEARNLIVCIDGTSNQFGRNNTNVVKLTAKVDLRSPHVEQYTYYSSGIGTRPSTTNIFFSRMKSAVLDKLDTAVAWNMREIVQDAYHWLAEMYKEGDRIYLFGFSRGAYQVRVLAGMIDEAGLLKTATEKQIRTAYNYYEAIRSRKQHAKQSAMRFKKTFCHVDVRAHFIGVWDTVSSIGLTRGTVFPFSEHACHVRHALALDERRVKFIPEYFKKMNVEPGDEKSKMTQHVSTTNDIEACTSDKKKSSSDVKEVWFAGSHSDVGGKSRPGMPFQSGNASLLWMRREAAEHGLVLKPTDVVWVPDDIDLGTSDSMGPMWRIVEYLPVKHQVTFSGDGGDALRWHRGGPRCIIPGQKVHASVLYAKSYKPRASLGRGFRIPIAHDAEDTELDWEEALFDETAAEHLVGRMENKHGVAPIHLDKLLFMLRFKEGKECVRNVPGWQGRFMALLKSDCESLVKLVAIITLYEASSNVDTHPESVPPSATHYIVTLPNPLQVFSDAKDKFRGLLDAYKHEDGPTVFTLLRPLAKHQDLRDNILTLDVLKPLIGLFDVVVSQKGRNFGQAMMGLDCLLQCEYMCESIIEMLGKPSPGSSTLRLEQMLEVNDKQLLIPALRMAMTMARIIERKKACSSQRGAGSTSRDANSTPKEVEPTPNNACSAAKEICFRIKPRISQLVKTRKGLVGLLAIEIFLALYDPTTDRGHVKCSNPHVRANLCSVVVYSDPAKGEQSDHGRHKLGTLFNLDTRDDREIKLQRCLFNGLIEAVSAGNTEERTAATKALLELWRNLSSCHQSTPENFHALLLTKLPSILVDQLRHKEKALLAAYALARCLNYDSVKVMEILKDNKAFAENIVDMLRLDYFDDAVGSVEGFEIFKDFMRYEDLRENIQKYDLSKLLRKKLVKGNPRETRTSLVYLSVLLSHNKDGPWTAELVKDGLAYLEKPRWNDRQAGVVILSALAQTEHGVAAISPEIEKMIGMLLPSTSSGPCNVLSRGRALFGFTDVALKDPIPKSPYLMFGPVQALCHLAQNEVLRDLMRETKQYVALKQLYFSETLTDRRHWYFSALTPRRTNVVETLDNLMKALDEEPEESGRLSLDIPSTAPPEIQSKVSPVIQQPNSPVTSMLPLDGVMTVAILAMMVRFSTILTALAGIYNVMKLRPWAGYLDDQFDGPREEQDVTVTQTKVKENDMRCEGSEVSEVMVRDGDVLEAKTADRLATWVQILHDSSEY